MLMLFYGGQILINDIADRMGWDYIDINPFIVGPVGVQAYVADARMTLSTVATSDPHHE